MKIAEREQMKINVKVEENGIMPSKAHVEDAGFDLYSPIDVTIPAHGSAKIDLCVCMGIPEGYVGFLKSKSGLNMKNSLVGEGVIDAGYTGSIVAKIYNHSDTDYEYKIGDKVIQIVILPIPYVELEEVKELGETDRGANGFGSSGK